MIKQIFKKLFLSFILILASISNGYAQSTLDCKGCVATKQLKNRSVKNKKIANNSVDSSKIKNDSITAEKLSLNSVTEDKIQDGSITKEKLSSNIKALGLDGFVTLSASNFQIDALNSNCAFDSLGYLRMPIAPPDICCAHSPVSIPNGVTIKSFQSVVSDNDGGAPRVEVQLFRKNLNTLTNSVEMAVLTSENSAAAQVLQANNINYLANTENEGFFVFVCFYNQDHRFYSSKITYE